MICIVIGLILFLWFVCCIVFVFFYSCVFDVIILDMV